MRLPRLLGLLALAGVLAAPASASAAPKLRTISFDRLNRLDRAASLGAAAASTPMRIGIALQRPDAAGEDALVHSLYDPASPRFHQFLTPAQFRAQYGVSSAARAATRRWLTGAGLHVDYAAPDYLLATGTVAQIQRLAHVSIGRYRFAGETFLANDRAPRVPAALPVLTISGLNTYERHHTTLTQSKATAGRTTAAGVNFGSQTPQDLWSIYEQPPAVVGSGVPVAILGNGATDQVIKDLHDFDAHNHFAQLPVDVVHTPENGDFSDDSGNGEWNIDMQAIHGMAPGISKEVLYFAPTLRDTDLVAATVRWVNDPSGPPIMNASLGECEVTPLNDTLNDPALDPINGNESANALPVSQGLSNSSEPAQTQALRQAVIEGRTLFAASGDAGSSCTAVYPGTNGIGNYGVPLTEDPANNPYAVGVGGTVLYSDGGDPAQRVFEYAWTHSGGNASPFEPAPDFQKGVSGLDRNCVTDSSTLCRGVPDVAALSGDVISNGYTIYSDGQESSGGGTSLSSPLWTGMWARLVSTAPAGSPGYGFADEAIYKVAKNATLYGQAFHDITQGTNGLNQAQTGYDYVTGLGVPRLSGLISAVQQVAPAAPAPTAPQASAPPAGAPAPAPAASAPAPQAPHHTASKKHKKAKKRKHAAHKKKRHKASKHRRRHTARRHSSHG
jgi:subtilase family serine protease